MTQLFRSSSIQQQIYLSSQMRDGGTDYTSFSLYRLPGLVDVEKLESAFREIVKRYEILRTHFRLEGDQVLQVIREVGDDPVEIQVRDFVRKGLNFQDPVALFEHLKPLIYRPFYLESDSLYRFDILKLASHQFGFLICKHLVVGDGTTLDLIVNETMAIYLTLSGHAPSPQPQTLLGAFSHYSQWESRANTLDDSEGKKFWSESLKSIEDLDLSWTNGKALSGETQTEIKSLKIPKEVSNRLSEFSKITGLSPFVVLMSVFNLLLHRNSHNQDLAIGTPVNLRITDRLTEAFGPEIMNRLGPLANTIPVRSQFLPDQTFLDFVKKTRNSFIESLEFSHFSYHQIRSFVQAQKGPFSYPLFRAAFAYVPLRPSVASECFVMGDPGGFDIDLFFRVLEGEESSEIQVRFDRAKTDSERIQSFLKNFIFLLDAAVLAPDLSCENFEIVNTEDRQAVVDEFSGQEFDFKLPMHLGLLFERQTDREPDRIALEFEDQKLSYRQLDRRANQLAHYLRAQGLRRDLPVVVLVDRSIEFFVSVFAIFKLGGMYVPLDPEHPQDRLQEIVSDLGSEIILTGQSWLEQAQNLKGPSIISVDRQWTSEIGIFSSERLGLELSPDDLAYIIFTSGSTGKPKGCMNTQKGAATCILGEIDKFEFSSRDRVLQKTPYTFDASIDEIFCTLCSGGTLVIAAPQRHRDAEYMCAAIIQHQITMIQLVPSMFQVLLDEPRIEECRSLRAVMSAGEALHLSTVRKFAQKLGTAILYNSYGPSETAVGCSYWNCQPEHTTVPIGRPLPNTRFFVLDPYQKLVPIGVVGELYICGPQVGTGYWKSDQLTVERFGEGPVVEFPGMPFYRTGDLAKCTGDGIFEFIGRKDSQVKIRGFRVELEEIEAAILKLADISQVAVLKKNISQGVEALVAYFVAKSQQASDPKLDPQILASQLERSLPSYMIPALFVQLPAMPVISSLKIDRRALLARVEEVNPLSTARTEPADEVEKQILNIWKEVLGQQNIGVKDNLFHLGANSLSLIRILQRLRGFQFDLSLRDLNDHPTVRGLSQVARHRRKSTREKLDLSKAEVQFRPEAVKAYYLTGMQNLMVQNYGGEASVYHCVAVYQILTQNLSLDLLWEAFHVLSKKHPSFSSFITTENDERIQYVRPLASLPTETIHLGSLSEVEVTKWIETEVAAEKRKHFDIDDQTQPLWRMKLYLHGSSGGHFIFTCHHAITDGWGMAAFCQEWAETYQALQNGRALELPQWDWSQAELVAMERSARRSEISAVWKKELAALEVKSHRGTWKLELMSVLQLEVSLTTANIEALRAQALTWGVSVKAIVLDELLKVISLLDPRGETILLVGNGRNEKLSNPVGATGLFWNFVPYFRAAKAISAPESIQAMHQNLLELDRRTVMSYRDLMDLNPSLKDVFSTFNFLDIQSTLSHFHEAGDTSGHAMTIRVDGQRFKIHDQFSFPLNFSVILTENGPGTLRCNFDQNTISSAQIEDLLESWKTWILNRLY